jgi:hypothetical protein
MTVGRCVLDPDGREVHSAVKGHARLGVMGGKFIRSAKIASITPDRRCITTHFGSRKHKIGTRGQAEPRDFSYLISDKPCMTQGPETSYDAGKFALFERSR